MVACGFMTVFEAVQGLTGCPAVRIMRLSIGLTNCPILTNH
jgi:hypothetical protein